MDHWDRCVADVVRYARSIRANPGAVEGIVRAYLNAPAFYPEWRRELLRIAMESR